MTRKMMRDFHCNVINEEVRICLCKKSTAGLRSESALFVMCNQNECQHVDDNKLPCPLNLSLFAEEIRAREETARLRREDFKCR